MKTMTEFIMEQEAPVTEELIGESFNENELVSQFMALQAASSNLDCMFEFATIANFCSENEITMPESLVQEGFGDTLKAIGKSIADWFKKIIEWFKGLIKGTASTFAKAKISDTIAKLEQYDAKDAAGNNNLTPELSAKVKYVAHAVEILWAFLVRFKECVIVSMEDVEKVGNASAEGKQYMHTMKYADEINAGLEKFSKSTTWIDSAGKLKQDAFDSIVTALSNNGVHPFTPEFSDADDAVIDVPTLIKFLKRINKFNIPKKGADLLKQLDAETKKFTNVEKSGTTGTAAKVTTTGDDKANLDKEMTAKIRKMANLLAKAYDEVTTKFASVTADATKDLKAENKEDYDKSVKREEAVAKKYDSKDLGKVD